MGLWTWLRGGPALDETVGGGPAEAREVYRGLLPGQILTVRASVTGVQDGTIALDFQPASAQEPDDDVPRHARGMGALTAALGRADRLAGATVQLDAGVTGASGEGLAALTVEIEQRDPERPSDPAAGMQTYSTQTRVPPGHTQSLRLSVAFE